MDRQQLLARLDQAWQDFHATYVGLPMAALGQPGVVDAWSVKDLIAHLATWEEETLKALPLIVAGKRPPRYGGVDRFNAAQSERNQRLSLTEARAWLADSHARLVALLEATPEAWFASETRFRHRLRLDTYGHYREHTAAVRAWRTARDGG
jgi:hypothetical protein